VSEIQSLREQLQDKDKEAALLKDDIFRLQEMVRKQQPGKVIVGDDKTGKQNKDMRVKIGVLENQIKLKQAEFD